MLLARATLTVWLYGEGQSRLLGLLPALKKATMLHPCLLAVWPLSNVFEVAVSYATLSLHNSHAMPFH